MTAERDFGRGMRLLRNAAGISQVALAKRLEEQGIRLDGSAVTRMEKGPRLIRLDEAAAVAAVFGHTVDGILRMVGSDSSPDSVGALDLPRLLGMRLRAMADELDGGAS